MEMYFNIKALKHGQNTVYNNYNDPVNMVTYD